MIAQAAEFVGRTQKLADCKDLVDQIKVLFKSKAEPAQAKLVGLRLLHECMLKGNNVFLVYVAKKMLSRLTTFGKYRKEDPNPDRGATMFNSQSQEGMQASSEFLQLLLIAIKTWASHFGKNTDGSPSPFLKAYTQLQREKVAFPKSAPSRTSPDKRSSPPPPPSAQFSLEEFINEVMLLEDAIGAADYQTPALKSQATGLQVGMRRLEAVIQEKANTGADDLEAYFEGNEFAQGAIKRLMALPTEKPRVNPAPLELPRPVIPELQKPQAPEIPRLQIYEPPRPISVPQEPYRQFSQEMPKLPMQDFPKPLQDPFKSQSSISDAKSASQSIERPPPAFNRVFSLPPQGPIQPPQPIRSQSPDLDHVPDDPPIPKINQSSGLGLPKQQQFDFDSDLVLNVPQPPQTERIYSTGEFDFEAEWEDPKQFQQSVNARNLEFQFDDVREEVKEEEEEGREKEYLDKIEEHERTIERQLEDLKAAKAQLADTTKALSQAKSSQSTLEAQLQAAQAEIRSLQFRLSEAELAPLVSSPNQDEAISSLQHDLESVKIQLETTQEELKATTTSLNSANITAKNMQQKYEASEVLSTELSRKVTELNGKLKTQLAAQMRDFAVKEAQYQAEMTEMREELEQVRASFSRQTSDYSSQTEAEMAVYIDIYPHEAISIEAQRRQTALVLTSTQAISVLSGPRILSTNLQASEPLLSPILPPSQAQSFQFLSGDLRAANPFESFQQDQSMDTSIIDLLSSQAFATEAKRPQPVNEEIFPAAYIQGNGVLYASERVEMRFKVLPHVGTECDIQIIVGNKGSIPIEIQSWQVTENAVGK